MAETSFGENPGSVDDGRFDPVKVPWPQFVFGALFICGGLVLVVTGIHRYHQVAGDTWFPLEIEFAKRAIELGAALVGIGVVMLVWAGIAWRYRFNRWEESWRRRSMNSHP
jgi:uncharacterized membrane protein YidH (DUF202 family)